MKKHLYILLLAGLFFYMPVTASAQSGCAEIVSISTNVTSVESGKPYNCTVTVGSGDGGSKSIACGVSFNGGYPLDYCPSDEFFGGWNGTDANFNCVFPNTNISDEITKVELVGYDFGSGCGPSQGKRVEVQLIKSPTPGAGTPTVTPAPINQEPQARSLLSQLLSYVFSGSSDSSDTGGNDNGNEDPGDGGTEEPGDGGAERPPTSAELSNAEEFSDRVLNDIKSACNYGGIAGKVTKYNVSCLNTTSFTPNARATAANNTNRYTYLQCFGLSQSLWAALNGDLASGSNPFLGHEWPTNLISSPRPGIKARFKSYNFSQCKELAKTKEHLILIWGTPGVFPGNQHIATGMFLSDAKTNLKTWEGNTDWEGTARIKNRPSSGAYAPAYCLIQTN